MISQMTPVPVHVELAIEWFLGQIYGTVETRRYTDLFFNGCRMAAFNSSSMGSNAALRLRRKSAPWILQLEQALVSFLG